MLADLAFFPFRQLTRLLVHNLGDLDLANIKQLCSLGNIVQQFFSTLQYLNDIFTACRPDQQLRPLIQHCI